MATICKDMGFIVLATQYNIYLFQAFIYSYHASKIVFLHTSLALVKYLNLTKLKFNETEEDENDYAVIYQHKY